MNSDNLFGELVYAYSRRQAIADGVLVDLTPFEISRQCWKMPIACSSAVWSAIEQAVKEGKHLNGILHDVYSLARFAIQPGVSTDRIYFQAAIGSSTLSLVLHCGPGDDLLPVLTLMTPADD